MKYLPLLVSLSVTILSACQVTQDTTPSDLDTINKTSTDRVIANAKKLITGQLENGMTYVIKKEPQFKNKASLKLLVKAGALQEDEQQRGLAHFVEHMAFNGTEDFPKNDLINYIESAGMRFGQGINAMTYFDKTVYSLIIPTNKSDLFESGFQIIENWAHKVSFDAKEIDKERGVIIEEWRKKDSANYRLESKHLSARYQGSRYSQRYPIVGELDDIKSAKAEDIIRFYEEWYQPENMVILAIGDFEPYQAMHHINKYIATIPSSKSNKKIHQYPLKNREEPIISTQTDPQATKTSISFQLNKPYQPTLTYKDELENIKKSLLTNLLNKRLQSAIRKNNIATFYAKTDFHTTAGQANTFKLSAIINPQKSQIAIKGLLAELYRPNQDGFDEQELTLVKSALKNYTKDHRKSTNLLKLSNDYINHIMNNEPLFDNHSIATYRLEVIDKVTLADINSFAKYWLNQQQNREIYISAPDSDLTSLPTRAELISLWEKAENTHYRPYQQEQIIEKLMPYQPSKGNIVKREYNELYRTHHWTLSNGAKVILKKRGSKKNELLFKAIKEGGHSQLDDDTYQKTVYSTNYIDYMGVSKFNINTLNTFLYDKNIKLRSIFNASTEGLKGSTSADYLEPFMQLIYLKFTQQRKSEQDFNTLIANQYTQMEKNSRVPLAKLFMEINAQKNKYNPRYIEQYDPAILDMIDFELSFKKYQQRFANAADFTFTFVGNIDLKQIEELVITYIASLPSSNKQPPEQKLHVGKPNKGHIEVHLKNGLDQKAFVLLENSGETTWSNKNKILFEMVKSTLNVLLRNKIREQLGGTYNISVKGKLNNQPQQEYILSTQFFCEPERVDELVNAVQSELQRIKLEGINQKLLDNFKKQQSIARKNMLSNNKYWLYKLSKLDEESMFDLNNKLYNKTLAEITVAQVNQAMNTYLNSTNSVYATLLPKNSPVLLATKQTQSQ